MPVLPELNASSDLVPDGFLDRPVARLRLPHHSPPNSWVGRRLGAWTLLEPLGEGGMATVFSARRCDGLFDREVAIKIARHDLDQAGLERFDRERRLLANFEHAGIARLYDGGLTSEGRPYLVMERIEGTTIDRHCRENRASVTHRVELVAQVAEAVAAAHERGIVHRDVKPDNVLVDKQGRAVLLDFGIAKLLEPPAEILDRARTRTDIRPMTPRWASPEQVAGTELTTASDVYSLGVLLYYLLCGKGPYRLKGDSLTELERAISEQTPAPPSRRCLEERRTQQTALEHPATGRRTARALRGDLDTIILAALAKLPRERYPSAGSLAADLRHWAKGEAIVAVPASRLRRLRAALRRQRRRWPVLLVAVALVSPGLVWVRSDRMAEDRLRSMAHAERMRNREVGLMLGLTPAASGSGESAELIERDLERGLERVEAADDPTLQASALEAAAEVFHHMGRGERASELLTRATAIREQSAGSEDLRTLESEEKLATLLQEAGHFDRAEKIFRHVLSARVRQLGTRHIETAMARNNLGMLLWESKRFDQAEPLLRDAFEIARAEFGEVHAATIAALGNLALVVQAQRRTEEAERLHRRELAATEELFGQDHLQWATSANNLSVFLRRQQRFDEALELAQRVVAVRERRLGPDHPATASALNNLGMAYFDTFEQPEQAENLLRRALTIREARLEPGHPDLEVSRRRLALAQTVARALASEAAAGRRPRTQ